MAFSAVIFGSTGMVGHQILTNLLATDIYQSIHTISRRAPAPAANPPKFTTQVETDTTKWASALASVSPAPSAVISGLGTTKAQAGGIENQWKIDHDLNVEAAKAAHAAGAKTFCFISGAGIRSWYASWTPYSKMKIGVEDTIKDLGFEQAIIVRPGAIMGDRENVHQGYPLMAAAINGLGKIHGGFRDALGQDAEVIGRAAVHALKLAREGKAPSKYWVLDMADIVRLGRDEWNLE